mmetsp:Transcript_8593/g.11160  ORF Transcript_8593/g.11160 Transcript_8593/m.11160 type:complete len:199 (-) Transcript_8593:1305-1901(-)
MGWEWRCFFPLQWFKENDEFKRYLQGIGLPIQEVKDVEVDEGRTDTYRCLASLPDSVGVKTRGKRPGLEVKLRSSIFPEISGLEQWIKYVDVKSTQVDQLLKREGFNSKEDISLASELSVTKVRTSCTVARCSLVFDQIRTSEGPVFSWGSISLEHSSKNQIINALRASEIQHYLLQCKELVSGGYPAFVYEVLSRSD